MHCCSDHHVLDVWDTGCAGMLAHLRVGITECRLKHCCAVCVVQEDDEDDSGLSALMAKAGL